jgi:tetratricopeptide (TPR) repeat protein
VWDAASGKPLSPPLEHHGEVLKVAFSPDGETLLTAGVDGVPRLWRLASPVRGSSKTILLWVQARTGLDLDRDGGIEALDFRAWEAARNRLAQLEDPDVSSDESVDATKWDRDHALSAIMIQDWFAARWHLDRLLAVEAADTRALGLRARALAGLGEFDAALADYEHALEKTQEDVDLLADRAELLVQNGRWKEALRDYVRLDQIRPDYAEAHKSVALTLYQLGQKLTAAARFEGAIAAFGEVIRIEPDNPLAHDARARVWATCAEAGIRDATRAIESATRACELSSWQNPICLDTLAAAYAEAGDFAKAVEYQEKANALYSAPEDHNHGDQRLKLYKERKPYREGPGK